MIYRQLSIAGSPPRNKTSKRVNPLNPHTTTAHNPTNAQPVGLILAGGLGRRFGGPKAFALLPDGRTFLDACAETMHRAGLTQVVVTLPPDVDGTTPPSVRPLRLPHGDLDMFASITLGLQLLLEEPNWRRVILLPVDHPLVTSTTVKTLASQDTPAAIPTVNGRHGHPIMISRGIAEKIVRKHLPGPTLREVLKAAPAHDVWVNDTGIRANCNTPEKMQSAWHSIHE